MSLRLPLFFLIYSWIWFISISSNWWGVYFIFACSLNNLFGLAAIFISNFPIYYQSALLLDTKKLCILLPLYVCCPLFPLFPPVSVRASTLLTWSWYIFSSPTIYNCFYISFNSCFNLSVSVDILFVSCHSYCITFSCKSSYIYMKTLTFNSINFLSTSCYSVCIRIFYLNKLFSSIIYLEILSIVFPIVIVWRIIW